MIKKPKIRSIVRLFPFSLESHYGLLYSNFSNITDPLNKEYFVVNFGVDGALELGQFYNKVLRENSEKTWVTLRIKDRTHKESLVTVIINIIPLE